VSLLTALYAAHAIDIPSEDFHEITEQPLAITQTSEFQTL
jgi:hypothetical protein